MLQHYITDSKVHALSSCLNTHSHIFSIRPPCFLHVFWCHTFNLCCTCTHHVYTMRNSCPLMSSLTLSPSRLFPILLDSKSFQTVLDYSNFYHMNSRSHVYLLSLFHCRLIIIILNPNPSPSLFTLSSYNIHLIAKSSALVNITFIT